MDDRRVNNLDEQHRRGLQEYIFDLEEIKERAEELSSAHEKLKRSQDLLLTILSCTVHGLCLIRDGVFVFGNGALGEIIGWDCDELVGKSIEVLCTDAEAHRNMVRVFDSELRLGGLSHKFELLRKDGLRVPCLVTGRALDRNDPSSGYVLSITDFTERHNSREALERANSQLAKHSAELTRINRELGREIEVRRRAEEKLNSYSGQLEEQVKARTAELQSLNETLMGEVRERRLTQERLQNEIAMRQDIEEALRGSETEYRAIFENTGAATVIIEEDTTISLANAEFEYLSGLSRDQIEWKRKWTEFIVEEDLHLMLGYHRLRRNDPCAAPRRYEARFLNRDGEVRQIAFTVAMIPGSKRSIASLLDITLQKAMEAEALKAQKLESIGILAGGIAHDFNNILTSIVGNISLAKMSTQPGDNILKRLEETEKASLRAKDLTQQLLTFSKGGKPVKKVLSIANLVRDFATFSLRGSRVKLELDLPVDLWEVEADEGQIGQVINNLAINADQAMPVGGVIRIEARNIFASPSSTLPLASGKYVRVAVADQGIGITVEHLGKIFDPYFSTKQKGSGLGLATVYSIIGSHGGHINAASEVGAGTTFTFYLPASEHKTATGHEWTRRPMSGKGRILVMDDETLIHDVLGEMLNFMGYEASFAHDGAEAIEIYRASKDAGNSFDLLIMDLTIPGGMGGREALDHLIEMDPGVRAIVSSGYSNDPVMANFKKCGFVGVISKPYRMDDLAQILDKVMNRE